MGRALQKILKSEGATFVGQFSVVKEHIVPFTLMCKKSGDMGHPVPLIGGETQCARDLICASNIWPKSKENGGFAHPNYGPNLHIANPV